MSSSSLLRDARVSSVTIVKYKTAVAKFFSHSYHQLSLISFTDTDALDDILSEYLEDMYVDGEISYTEASYTLSGLHLLFPRLCSSTTLCESHARMVGWKRLCPSTSYPPLTWEVTCAIAMHMALSGHVQHAVATLLAFDCYLRISEFSRLSINDIVCPALSDARSSRVAAQVIVCLARAKTGINQSVTVRRASVADILIKFLLHRIHGDKALPASPLFEFSFASYRSFFTRSCAALGLSHIGYVPHSLRHGGATFDFQNHLPMLDVMQRGRWAVLKSAQRYVQSGVSLLRLHSVPHAIFLFGCSVADSLVLAFSALIFAPRIYPRA